MASHAVEMPVREDDGSLGFRTALVGRGQEVREGFLPFTRENIIRQAFKFLGERYGWGHSYNARDCTGLVLEVYKSMGIDLPRNSSQQGNSPIGENIRLPEGADDRERRRELRREAPARRELGDLLADGRHDLVAVGGQADDDADASGDGGGIFNHGTINSITNSTFSGNSASDGGGIYNSSGSLTVMGNKIAGNTATSGGGVYQAGGDLSLDATQGGQSVGARQTTLDAEEYTVTFADIDGAVFTVRGCPS